MQAFIVNFKPTMKPTLPLVAHWEGVSIKDGDNNYAVLKIKYKHTKSVRYVAFNFNDIKTGLEVKYTDTIYFGDKPELKSMSDLNNLCIYNSIPLRSYYKLLIDFDLYNQIVEEIENK